MNTKKALITGVTGQDGAYLTAMKFTDSNAEAQFLTQQESTIFIRICTKKDINFSCITEI